RRREGVGRRDVPEARTALRRAGAGRHVPEPRHPSDVFRAHLQAHPRAALAADVHVRRADVSGAGQRRNRPYGGAVSEELLEGLLPCRRYYHLCVDPAARPRESLMFTNKSKMPSASDALKGRAEKMPVPATHHVLGTPLEGPFPAG